MSLGMKLMLWEKDNYKFKNYRHTHFKSVIMPGCNFSSFFPNCTKELMRIADDNNMGYLYECCGKHMSEIGLNDRGVACSVRIGHNLEKNGVEELVCCCPNCYHYMKDKINIPIVSIYAKLRELGIGNKIVSEQIPIFYPCPEKASNFEILEDLKFYLDGEIIDPLTKKIPCCHVNQKRAAEKPELQGKLMENVVKTWDRDFYTYCATCICYFGRGGVSGARHVLPEILGIDEPFPGGCKPWLNRAKLKFI